MPAPRDNGVGQANCRRRGELRRNLNIINLNPLLRLLRLGPSCKNEFRSDIIADTDYYHYIILVV